MIKPFEIFTAKDFCINVGQSGRCDHVRTCDGKAHAKEANKILNERGTRALYHRGDARRVAADRLTPPGQAACDDEALLLGPREIEK